jgi:DNA (cytosine-5)-methyltransferase 1
MARLEGTVRVAMAYSFVSLFTGIGGLDLGFEQEGFRPLWAHDILKAAVESYSINFGRNAILGDINTVSLDAIPPADVIIGGPPCQSFSLVGKRRPNDPRGNLVFRFVEIVRALRPRAFAFENVTGIAASSVNGLPLLDVLKERLEEVGYNVTQVVLSATDFFVPQRRRRLFLLGSLDAVVLPPDGRTFLAARLSIDPDTVDLSAKAAIGDLSLPGPRSSRVTYGLNSPSAFATLMREGNSACVSLHEHPRMSCRDLQYVRAIPPGGNYMQIPDHIATPRVLKFKKTGGRTTTYGRLHPDQPAYTINAYFRRPNVGCHFHYSEERLITPREAMRFQALPDRFEIIYSTREDRNALIGNAVPPLMAQGVAYVLREALERADGSRFVGPSRIHSHAVHVADQAA